MQDADSANVKQLQQQLQSQQQQLRISHSQSEQLQRLQQAIIRMYLEFRDRAADELANIQQETQEQLKEEQPLVILDRLRAQLRILLSFKDDFENQLKMKTTLTDKQSESNKKDVQSRLLDAQDKIFNLKQELSKAKSDINNFESERDNLAFNHIQQLENTKHKITSLEKFKQELEEQNNEKDQRLKKYNLMMKNQDLKLARISELEAKLQQKETEFQSRIAKVQTLDRNEIIRLQKEINNFKKVEQENIQMRAMNKNLAQELQSFKNNIKSVKYAEACQLNIQLQQQLHELSHKFDSLHAAFKQSENDRILAQLDLKNATTELQQLKSDTEKFSTVKPQHTAQNPNSFRQTPKQNTSVIAQYELQTALDKLLQRDREIEELAKRVRKLLALQHKAALAQKAFQEEKQSLEKQIQQLRDEVAQLRKMHNFSTQNTQKSSNSDELLRDVQNLRAFAITASSAYGGKTTQKQQNLAVLDDVSDPREFLKGRGQSAKLTPGRGGGYGTGGMLGGRGKSAVQFGLG